MALFYDLLDDHAVLTRYLPEADCDMVCIPEQTDGLPVTEIGPGVFRHCEELRTVILPMTLKHIGNDAFSGCKKLTCVGVAQSEHHSVFPPELSYIGKQAFRWTGLRELSFSSSQLELDSACFQNTSVVSAFFVGTDITLRDAVFAETAMEIVAMPEAEITNLGARCFASCSALHTVKAKQINAVGDGCFHGCSSLEDFSARHPLLKVGNGAFYGCGLLRADGFFRSMFDLILAWGVDHIVNETAKRKWPYPSWQSEHCPTEGFQATLAARRLIDKIKATPYRTDSQQLLLSVIGSAYYSMGDGWDYCDRFLLYDKQKIRERFRDIWSWQITEPTELCSLNPPERYIGSLSEEEVYNCLRYELSPRPSALNWDDLDTLLNAELGGISIHYHLSSVTDFLSCLLDHEFGVTPYTYRYVPTAKLDEEYFGEDFVWLTDEEKLHRLRWDILFNRIAIHQELKYAHTQLLKTP